MTGRESEEYATRYFVDQELSIAEFWRRLGGRPGLDRLDVLEIGCGHGALAVDMASRGAQVTAVDLDEGRIAFARKHIAENFPELVTKIDFECVDATTLRDRQFDLIVSKDSLEHVADVPILLGTMRRLLRATGRVYLGFSPLYYSPFGDHGRFGLRFPWAHVILPKRLLYRIGTKKHGHPVRSLLDIGLNGLTSDQYEAAIAESGLETVEYTVNRGDGILFRLFRQLRRLRWLRKYTTVNVYAILARTSDEPRNGRSEAEQG